MSERGFANFFANPRNSSLEVVVVGSHVRANGEHQNQLCTLTAGRVLAGTADLTGTTVPRQHRLITATAVSLCARKAGWVGGEKQICA